MQFASLEYAPLKKPTLYFFQKEEKNPTLTK